MLHTLPTDRLEGLSDPARGLDSARARERLQRYGPNDIVEVPHNAWRALLRDTARDPMLWFLVGTALVYALLGDWSEAAILAASIVPLAGMDAWLHRRTTASTAGLRTQLATRARVLRDGRELELPIGELVPGDLALVAAGEPFPADGLIAAAEDAQVDESALTGESFPVRKQAPASWPAPAAAARVDAASCGFAGTRLLTGRARLRVASTGGETLYGAIVRSAVLGVQARTPMQISIAGLVQVLVVFAAVLCLALAAVRLLQGHGWLDALVSAMTLAVAALPEEFPVVFTVFLGVGVHRLAQRRALVRRAASVENIGRVTTICTDKTGTLTGGVLELTHVLPCEPATRAQLIAIARWASQPATLDPLDLAVCALADAEGIPAHAAELRERFPFTEDRKRATAILAAGGGWMVATKGSPERVFALCTLDAAERAAWEARVLELAEQGHKLIACASLALPPQGWSGGEPERGFALQGLLAFEDPLRPGVRAAVAECQRAGLHTIVVTGDHPATARAIAREIGLAASREPRVLLGEDLEALVARAPREVRELDVVARAVPAQKLALVRALQALGEVVAVTGDGVNDVPALQAADVGIAMGQRGTRSAREIAAIVLLDDDFGTIVRAIAEGRQLFRNLQASFQYLLMIHVPLVLSAAVIPLAGFPLVFLPIHIVWLELLIHPTALLVFQGRARAVELAADPRRGSGAFFARADWLRIASVGALLTLLVVAGYALAIDAGRAPEHARAMVMVALCCASATVMAILSRLASRGARWIALATLAQAVLLVQTPFLAQRLHMTPLHLSDWLIAFGGACVACAPLALRARARRAPTPAESSAGAGAAPARGA